MRSEPLIHGENANPPHFVGWVQIGLVLLCLTACQTPPERSSAVPLTVATQESAAIAEQTVRYKVRPDLSDVRFLVFRDGPLARLGHSHVIQARNISGNVDVAPMIRESRFSIEIPVAEFVVDPKSARQDEGKEFAIQPDDEAIAGTTKNMLSEKVMDATRYPVIEIRSVSLNGPEWGMDVAARIRLHGAERDIVIPTAIDRRDGQLVATALFQINQTDFGITPMSILGGAIRVGDSVRIRMRIVAEQENAAKTGK